MSKRMILFFLWCGLLLLGSGAAAWTGWSPYGDDDGGARSGPHGGSGHGGGYYGGHGYGPMHK